jgi:tartrate-resistant acid phosphatase type 5
MNTLLRTVRNIVLVSVLFITTLHSQPVRFAIIGDYGLAGQPELDVANLVKSWNAEFVITLGDNNYELGSATTVDQNIGQYYHEFISPYTGSYGLGDTVNRFFPCLGNHDWNTAGATPYLNYFTLPDNERYYDFVRGTVHFFVVDSDTNEPDGTLSNSLQAQWLHDKLDSSTAQWKLIYFHHPPYSSGTRHGSTVRMQWPFQSWGATAVLSGHEHNYERIVQNNFPYFVNGLGGRSLYTTFGTPVAGSQIRYASNYGAMLCEANEDSIIFKFVTRTGVTIDSYSMYRPGFSTTQVSLNQGWNMISLPLHVADSALTTLFPGAGSHAFLYNGLSYDTHDTLESGKGYWIKSSSVQSIQLFGESIHRDTITVAPDWNLIGTISDPIRVSDIVQEPTGIIVSPFFGYVGNYQPSDTLYPGKAYWVKVSQAGALILNKSSSASPGLVK